VLFAQANHTEVGQIRPPIGVALSSTDFLDLDEMFESSGCHVESTEDFATEDPRRCLG